MTTALLLSKEDLLDMLTTAAVVGQISQQSSTREDLTRAVEIGMRKRLAAVEEVEV